jgi:riboflavin biosynthesis pyrimidine reductase
MKLLERIYAVPELPVHRLPSGLAERYDGGLGFEQPRVYANFVSSIDGIVALPSVEASPSLISGKSEGDRFVMALLRAYADVVLVGAGTLRAEPTHRWTPEFVYPQGTAGFSRLRAEMGLKRDPALAVLTSSGRLDPGTPALEGALVITTPKGARRVERRGGFPGSLLVIPGEDDLDLARVIRELRSRGMRMILTEGGPTVMGRLLELRLIAELFLTISPILLGRTRSEFRPGLAEGVNLLHKGAPAAEVLTVHRHRSHMFLRYLLAPSETKGRTT